MTSYLLTRRSSRGREEAGIASEERDKEKLIKLSLGFGPSFLKLYKEVGILCTHEQCLLHGYIDLMYNEKDKGIYVAIKDYELGSMRDVSKYSATRSHLLRQVAISRNLALIGSVA